MADVVTEVHSITSASPGWKLSQSGLAVACFALVSTTSKEHPGQFNERLVIPLGIHDLSTDLLGREIDFARDDVEFNPD